MGAQTGLFNDDALQHQLDYSKSDSDSASRWYIAQPSHRTTRGSATVPICASRFWVLPAANRSETASLPFPKLLPPRRGVRPNMLEYQPVTQKSAEVNEEPVFPSKDLVDPLFHISRWLKAYILIVALYAVLAVAALGWALVGSPLPGGRRVLRTGKLHVNQFYSGLALSGLLAPAGVIIRKISSDFTLLYPFSIASRRSVTPVDLDRILNHGVLALRPLFKYSRWNAFVQAILLVAGTALVPIGTLILTTGSYIPQTKQTGVVGLPTASSGTALHVDLGGTSVGIYDQFLGSVVPIVQGEIIQQNGVLKEVPMILGPTPTTNITFEIGVQYEGIVTYDWLAQCESSLSNIRYTISYDDSSGENITFTFPDGVMTTVQNDLYPRTVLWSNATTRVGNFSIFGPSNATVPSGGSLMFVTTGPLWTLVTYAPHAPNLVFTEHSWISSVMCTPRLHWDVSSCTWDGNVMNKCISMPGSNTTVLDAVGLDGLDDLMTSAPWAMQIAPVMAFGLDSIELSLCFENNATGTFSFRAPGVDDHRKLFGVIAESMAALASGGYYGVAEVPTYGQPERSVYIIRMYVLGLVLAMFLAVLLVSVGHVAHSISNHVPFEPATFLSIAASVRGPWWDQQLKGAFSLREKHLRQLSTPGVMFGVDTSQLDHIGLAPNVLALHKNARDHQSE